VRGSQTRCEEKIQGDRPVESRALPFVSVIGYLGKLEGHTRSQAVKAALKSSAEKVESATPSPKRATDLKQLWYR